MNFKLKVHNIWEFGQKKDFEGHPHQDDSMFPEFGHQDDSDRLFILCDGAGDNNDGYIASTTVCRVMSQVLLHDNHDEDNSFSINDFFKALDIVFDTINKEGNFNKKISTTLAFLKFHKEGVFIAHIGNSRVYHIRPGISGDETQIVFETFDHTYGNDLIRIGAISPINAKYHPQRNVVTRSIQPGSNKSKADIYQIKDIKPDDYFFMCTDGMVEQPDMADGTSLKGIFSELGGNDDNKVGILRSITEMNRDNHSAFLIHVLDVESADEKNLETKTNKNSDMSPQTLPIGTIVNSGTTSYTIKDVLGMGSFGITYLASGNIRIGNISYEVPFAIKEHFMDICFREKNGTKVLYTPNSRNDVELSRKDFLTEAKRLQQLCNRSKYIVKVNETFEANGTAYYVMEFLSGGTLKCNNKQQAKDYILKIAEAVKVLHDNKILHMDIKPSNIILNIDVDTNELYPVLIDFGIIKHFDSKGESTTAPHTKGVSTGYSPIEQYSEVTMFSPTIDLYALGATLFYLLTGKNPPSAPKLLHDSKSICEDLSNARCDEFIPIITKAMASNYQDRYCSVDEFVKALKNITISPNEIHREKGYRETVYSDIAVKTILPPSDWDLKTRQTPAAALYRHVCTFNKSLKFVNNPYIEGRLRSIIVAQDTNSNLYGIIDSQNNVIVPFEYTAIGQFVEVPKVRGDGFSYGGWRVVAPYQKNMSEDSYEGGLEVRECGDIVETYFDRETQPYFHFPNDRHTTTHEVIKQQSFEVNGKLIDICIQRIPRGKWGITDGRGCAIAPFIYDSIEPFSEHCMLPGPGLPPMFIGAKYTIGDKIGFFKITEKAVLIDYKRFDIETYKGLCTLT